MVLSNRILVGLAAGAVLGMAANALTGGEVTTAARLMHAGAASTGVQTISAGARIVEQLNQQLLVPVGHIFLRLLLMVVVPLIVTSLSAGVASLGNLKKISRLGIKTLSYFIVTTMIAATLGLLLAHLLQPGADISTSLRANLLETYRSEAVQQVDQAKQLVFGMQTLINIVPRNPLRSAVEFDMLGLIFFSLAFGVALTLIPRDKSVPVVKVLEGVGLAVEKLIHFALHVAPVGVFALMFTVSSRFGLVLCRSLGWFMLTVVLGLALHVLIVVLGLVHVFGRVRPLVFLAGIRDALMTAFSTSSSNATLPTALTVAEHRLKVDPAVAGFVLPLGSTMCMNGTALFQGVAVLFLAQVMGVTLPLATQAWVVLLAALVAVGAAGVPGGSLPLLVILLQTVGIPGEALALILGVDRLLDMCRTTVNVAGDLAAACVIGRWEKTATTQPQAQAKPSHMRTSLSQAS